MLDTISSINSAINDIVWGIPALTLLVGTGVLTLSGTVLAITNNYVNRKLKKNSGNVAIRAMLSYDPKIQAEHEKMI